MGKEGTGCSQGFPTTSRLSRHFSTRRRRRRRRRPVCVSLLPRPAASGSSSTADRGEQRGGDGAGAGGRHPLAPPRAPQHTVLGADTQVLSVGPRFRGMKMVPPGPHFLHYCSLSRHGNEFAQTVRFFLATHPSELVYKCGNDNWRTSAGRGVASKRFFCGKFTWKSDTLKQ